MQATSVADPKPFRLVLAVLVGLLLALLVVTGARSYFALETAREKEAEIQTQIDAAEENIHHLEQRLEQLATDPNTLENLAREELWMAKPNDVVIMLPPDPEVKAEVSGGQAAGDSEKSP